ncbi:MAG: Holliday junction resolvase RuvX [Candidatus Melainabacteria bacterium]|nr:Holliday junction resolvase RuvX [Candidatus Melainabacteria bacterium]
MGSILSIDYGTKRIGLAISDPSRIFAFPCGVIQNKDLNNVLSYISKLVTDREIDLVIVGMPYNMNSDNGLRELKGEMAKTVEVFVKKLKEVIKVSVEIVDERLSSFAAEEKLKERGISLRDSKGFIDQEAARLLLEEFIQKIKET